MAAAREPAGDQHREPGLRLKPGAKHEGADFARVAAGPGGHRDQGVGPGGGCLLGVAEANDVGEHPPPVGVHALDHRRGVAERGDHQRHPPGLYGLKVRFQAGVILQDQVDAEGQVGEGL